MWRKPALNPKRGGETALLGFPSANTTSGFAKCALFFTSREGRNFLSRTFKLNVHKTPEPGRAARTVGREICKTTVRRILWVPCPTAWGTLHGM